MSYMLLWQPSECVHLINDCVMLFSENKYDDDDDGNVICRINEVTLSSSVSTGMCDHLQEGIQSECDVFFRILQGVGQALGISSNTAHERYASLAHISHSWRFYPAVGEPPPSAG